MIQLIKTPQRADIKADYEVKGDILTITIGDTKEVFDFTGVPEGRAESILIEALSANPIVSAEKQGDTITITVIEFYGREEAHLHEV